MSWSESFLKFKTDHPLDSVKANQLRQVSFDQFLAGGLPTKKLESWKYTSLSAFKATDWSTADQGEEILTHDQMQEVSRQLPSEFTNFVFINGFLNQTLSDDSDGLLQVIEPSFESATDNVAADIEQNIFNLAQAFLNKVVELKTNKHQQLEKPIQIVFVQSSKKSVYLSEKLIIKLAENSEAQIIVNTISFLNGQADALNLAIDIDLAKSSRLQFVQLQNEDHGSFHFSQVSVKAHAQSQLTSLVVTLGNLLTRNFYHLNLIEDHAETQVYGLSILDQNQHADNYTFIQHTKGENQSNQHYKSILSGEAHSVFRGRVRIEQDAQKANSEQLNNNLLLTRTAQADSVPQLEIFADDVKAGHGSTVGQLNKDEIFYFLSRGINQYEAVKMLSYGYAKELVYKISNQSVQNFLIKALNTKLEKLVQNV